MAKNFLEGFARGFSIVGADILDRKQKQDDEIEAYGKKVDKQKEADVWVQKELMKAKQDASAKNAIGASFLFNQRNELNTSAQQQGQTLFGTDALQVEPPITPGGTTGSITGAIPKPPAGTVPLSANDASSISSVFDNSADANIDDNSDNTVTDTTVIDPLANNTQITREEFEAAKAGLSASTLENSSPEAVYTIAMAKAMKEKAKANKPMSDYQAGMLKVAQGKAGMDSSGKYQSYVDLNPDLLVTVKNAGLPESIIDPTLKSKGMIANAKTEAATKASADYFHGGKYDEALAQVQLQNNKVRDLLGLAQAADTGLLSGSINSMIGKLGGNGKLVNEYKSALAAVGPSMRPPGSGSSSDPDMKLYLSSVGDLANPATTNIATATRVLDLGRKVEEKLQFKAWLSDTAGLAAPGKAEELFQQYWKANPAFSAGKDGIVVENPNRTSFQNWDFNNNKPKQGSATIPQGDAVVGEKNPFQAKMDALLTGN